MKGRIFLFLCLIVVCSCGSQKSKSHNNDASIDDKTFVSAGNSEERLRELLSQIERKFTWQLGSGSLCTIEIKYDEEKRNLLILMESNDFIIDESQECADAFETMFLSWLRHEKNAFYEIIRLASEDEITISVIAKKSENEQLKVILDNDRIAEIYSTESGTKDVAREWLESMILTAKFFNKNQDEIPVMVGNSLIYYVELEEDEDFNLKYVDDMAGFADALKQDNLDVFKKTPGMPYFIYNLFKACIEAKVNVTYHYKGTKSGKTVDVIFSQSEMQEFVNDNAEAMTQYVIEHSHI